MKASPEAHQRASAPAQPAMPSLDQVLHRAASLPRTMTPLPPLSTGASSALMPLAPKPMGPAEGTVKNPQTTDKQQAANAFVSDLDKLLEVRRDDRVIREREKTISVS